MCEADDFSEIPYTVGLITALVFAVIAPLIAFTNLFLVPIAIFADFVLITIAHYYLYGRLILFFWEIWEAGLAW